MAIRIRFTNSGRSEAAGALCQVFPVVVGNELIIGQGESDTVIADTGDENLFKCISMIVLRDKDGAEVARLYNATERACQLTLKPSVSDGGAGEEGSGTMHEKTWLLDPTDFSTGSVLIQLSGTQSYSITEVRMASGDYWVKDLRGRDSYQCVLPFIVENV